MAMCSHDRNEKATMYVLLEAFKIVWVMFPLLLPQFCSGGGCLESHAGSGTDIFIGYDVSGSRPGRIRSKMAEEMKLSKNSSTHASCAEIAAWIEKCFSRDYWLR
jgi:hypothetical protein